MSSISIKYKISACIWFSIFILPFILLNSCKEENAKTHIENEMTSDSNNQNKNSQKLTAELEYKVTSLLGEGAIWNHVSQELYWVDIEGKKVNIYNPDDQTNRVINTPSRIGTLVPKSKTDIVVALEDGIYILDLIKEEFTLLSDIERDIPTNRFNDGKADPSGRLWVGSMAFDQSKNAAKLYMVDYKGKTTQQLDSVTISNGISWSNDKKFMYYIDTPTSTIKTFDFNNENGNITNGRITVKIPESLGFPDGMTIDSEGMLWVGMWNGNAVIRFDPETGEVLQKINVPAHNVTSCSFGGENLDILYITTSSLDMTDEEKAQYPLAGSLFKVITGVKGVKSSFFGNEQ